MRKAYKFRIFPSKVNITKLNRILELCRFVYNRALAYKINQYKKHKKSYSRWDIVKWVVRHKPERPELALFVYSQILQDVIFRLHGAYQGFFDRLKTGKKVGFPRYQGENRYHSFTFPESGFGFKIQDNQIFLSKVGWIKANFHREIEGTIKQLTITKSSTGKWYAIFNCVVEPKKLRRSKRATGFDLGITSFIADSDGNKTNYPRHHERAEKQLKRSQRKLEREKKTGTKQSRQKVRKTLTKKYEKVKNKRNDFLHKLSRKLVNENGSMIFERLNVKALSEKHWVSKQIADASWSRFIQYVSYKAEWAGRSIVLVNPAYTSQTCSRCGHVAKKKLSDRVHRCSCGYVEDRDVNAAKNILGLGLESLASA